MKNLLLLLTGMALFSCSNKYKLTQTPDDVYFSPVIGYSEETGTKDKEKKYDRDQRSITMARHDRRWRDFDDDYDYRYDPYHYGYNYGYYYNPYYYPYPVYTGITNSNPRNSTPRTTNLGSYTFINTTVPNPKSQEPVRYTPGRRYNNSNHGIGNTRNILFPGSGNSESNGTRTYSPGSSSSGNTSSGSSSGSGNRISRPGRN